MSYPYGDECMPTLLELEKASVAFDRALSSRIEEAYRDWEREALEERRCVPVVVRIPEGYDGDADALMESVRDAVSAVDEADFGAPEPGCNEEALIYGKALMNAVADVSSGDPEAMRHFLKDFSTLVSGRGVSAAEREMQG